MDPAQDQNEALHPFEPDVNLPEPPSQPPEPGSVAGPSSEPEPLPEVSPPPLEPEPLVPPAPPEPEAAMPLPPPLSTAEPTPEPETAPLVEEQGKGIKLNNKIIAALVVLLIGLLAGGIFFAVNAFIIPTKIKEKVELTQPIFEEYARVIKNIAEDLKEENPTATDSESIERAKQKSDALVKSEVELEVKLSAAAETLNMKQLAAYKTNLTNYQQKAKELVVLEKDAVTFTAAYVDSIREYEELTVDISGASNYILSDPDKYLTMMGEVVAKYKSLIENLKKAQLQGEMEKMNQAVIKRMEDELSFIEKIKDAVEARDADAIAEAEQKWTQSLQDSTKDINRVADRFNEVVKEVAGTVDSLKGKVDGEYGQLRSRYKF